MSTFSLKREILAGITTFMTMGYIVIVNPAILEAAGIPRGPAFVATILSAAFGCIFMGIYAKRPFAIAPYMGENVFIAYTVVKVLGYSWQTALGAIFVSGIIFVLITVFKLRPWLSRAIPISLKYGFAVGIGLFLTLIGLTKCGIVKLGVEGAPLHIGGITDKKVLVGILGTVFTSILVVRKIKGAILIGILTTTVVCFLTNITPIPKSLVSLPPSILPVFFKLDIVGAISWGMVSVILAIFVMDFVDTMGTLIGVGAVGGFLDEQGNLPEIEKPMLVDAISTVVGALFGTTTCGTYIESAAGIEEGGKKGVTAIVVGILFLGCLFFAPILTCIPPQAYGGALIVVGMLMLPLIKEINFKDFTEFIPAFFVIVLMAFTYNIGIGMTSGFVLYPIFKMITKRRKEVHPGMWGLFFLSLLFYIFYPY